MKAATKTPMETTPATTLHEAKEWLRNHVGRKGAPCPCCRQFAKVHRRPLNTNMCLFLIALVRQHRAGLEWVHYSKCVFKGRDYNFLKHHRLAETMLAEDRKKKKMSGLWRATEAGHRFVEGLVKVPDVVWVYDNRIMERSDKLITIKDALGRPYSFEEMMASEWRYSKTDGKRP